MTPLDALAEVWRDVKEPTVSEILAEKCSRCRVARVPFPRQTTQPPAPLVTVSKVDATLSDLTQRELEVVTLTALGHNVDQTASQLFLSPMTVKSHKARIYRKLNIKTSAELGVLAAKAGLV